MKSPRHELNEINKLIELAIEGTISPEQGRRLNDLIVNDSQIRRHYCEYIQLSVCIERLSSDITVKELPEYSKMYDEELWKQLAREEELAPQIEEPSKPFSDEIIQKVVYPPREKRKLTKFSIFMLMNAAAVVLFFLYLRFVPPSAGIEVATLVDSIDAKWANVSIPMETGTRLTTGSERLLLREGYAEFLFDNQTRITIESPAEFQVLTDDRVYLNYGKVYLTVPREAIGFSVYTQNTKIIDLGTEFGVLAELGGNTQLHVLKGRTLLMAGKADNVNMEVSEGVAKKITKDIGEISDIECRSEYFVRDINSESHCIWKGQSEINLADIVGGGNGLGTGIVDMGIHPISGKPIKAFLNDNGTIINEYHAVPSTPYIDGMFIPNGRIQQIISSKGHVFQECPITSGDWFISPENVMRTLDSKLTQDPTDTGAPFVPCIVQHANIGITYDLHAIRSVVPHAKIIRFRTKLGVGSETDRPCNADFWVLVDGKLRYKKTRVTEKEKYYSVDIELSERDRFLTLITTDGGDPEGQVLSTIDSDWCRFFEPVLVLE